MRIQSNQGHSSKSRDELLSSLRRLGLTEDQILNAGHWKAACHSPCRIEDVGKLSHYCKRSGFYLPRSFDKGIITAKEVDLYKLFAPTDMRRDLDRLLSGGGTRWTDEWKNIVVNEGLAHALDVALSGGTQDTTWFVGLLAASPTVLNAWTATEVGANDFVNYDEATLQAFTDGGVSGTTTASLDNSASTADFTIDTNSSSIGGAFLIGTNTKATPAGTVYAAGAFTGGNKAADDNDTLQVTATFTMTDA